MDGFGNLTWPDGIEYIGEFAEDKFDGYGEYYWNDGQVYIGKWRQGFQNDDNGYIIEGKQVRIGKYVMGSKEKEYVEDLHEELMSDIHTKLSLNQMKLFMLRDIKAFNNLTLGLDEGI